MGISVTVIYRCGRRDVSSFTQLPVAVRYAEWTINNDKGAIISVLMQGPEGEREFIK